MNVMSRRNLLAGAAALTVGSTVWTAATAQAAKAYTWQTVPFGGGGFVDGFLYHPKEKGLLYARTDVGGAYRFDPQAKGWTSLTDFLGPDDADLMGVLAMALDPNDPSKLYMACGEYLGEWARDGAVLCSGDRGSTWSITALPAGVKLGGNADGRGTGERLIVHPADGATLVLGTSQDGLFVSRNAGKAFTRVDGLPIKRISLVLMEGAGQALYVGSAEDQGGLYKSSDGGATFALMKGLPNFIPQRAALDVDGNLYVTLSNGRAPWGGDNGAVYRLDAKGGEWQDISPMKPGGGNPNFAYCGLDISGQKPGTLVVSTMNRWATHDDIYLSRDGGKHWKPLGPQSRHDPAGYPWLVDYLKGEDWMGHWIADVKIDPFNPASLIYGTGYGLWMTWNLDQIDGNGDLHFEFIQKGFEETAVLDLASPPAGATVYAAMGDVAGAGWDDAAQPPKAGLFRPNSESNLSVDFAALAPEYVVRTSDPAATNGYFSTDGGLSWRPFPTTPHKRQNAKGEWQNAGRISISAKGTSLLWLPDKEGAFFSRDMGKTWSASKGVAASDRSLSGTSDRAVDGVFYIHDRLNNAVLISVDAGASFQPVIKGLPKIEGWQGSQIVATPGRMRDIWLALPQGLFHSADEKTPLANVKGVDAAWLVALGAAPAGQTYPSAFLYGKVKGRAGIWRSDDVGQTWLRVNDDLHQFGALRAMAADPLEFGTVYIGPHGRGVMVGRPARA